MKTLSILFGLLALVAFAGLAYSGTVNPHNKQAFWGFLIEGCAFTVMFIWTNNIKANSNS